MSRRFILALALVFTLVSLSACVGTGGSARSDSTVPTVAPAVAVPVKAMTIAQKQQLIADNFQPEVPVPSGTVARGEAQGDYAWDYELVVEAPPADVANWYLESYLGRDWELVDKRTPTPGAITLTMVKHAAQSRISITPESGGKSRVKAVVGVGTPVLQTQ